MKLLADYFKLRNQIFEYFGYVEDWRVLPIYDSTIHSGGADYWRLDEVAGTVKFAPIEENLDDEDAGDYYENTIYKQRHLPKWVYRGADYTMIVVDTHTDGNQFLQIFDNKLER